MTTRRSSTRPIRGGRPLRLLTRFARDEDGATAIEYALIAGLIFLAIVSSVRLMGVEVGEVLAVIAKAMKDAL